MPGVEGHGHRANAVNKFRGQTQAKKDLDNIKEANGLLIDVTLLRTDTTLDQLRFRKTRRSARGFDTSTEDSRLTAKRPAEFGGGVYVSGRSTAVETKMKIKKPDPSLDRVETAVPVY